MELKYKIQFCFGCLAIFLSLSATAQIEFKTISKYKDAALDKYFNEYILIEKIASNKTTYKKEEMSIEFQISPGEKLSINFQQNQLLSNSHTSSYKITEHAKLKYPELTISSYDGYIEGDTNNKNAKAIIGSNYFSLMANYNDQIWLIEDSKKFNTKSPKNHYILYKMSSLKTNSEYTCQRNKYFDQIEEQITHKKSSDEHLKNAICRLVEISMVADYNFYQSHNYDFETTIGELATILNVVENDYSSLVSDGGTVDLEFNLVELAVSVCEYCDPWTSSTNGSTLLDDFNYWAINGGLEKSFDIAGLMSGRTYDNNLVGLANHDRACENGRTFIIRNFSEDLGNLRVMTSHEIGHNFGCVHNYELGTNCAATVNRDRLIMDPSVSRNAVNWSNGTQNCAVNSLEVLTTRVSTLDCLGSCGVPICDQPTNLKVTGLSKNNLTVTWSGTSPSYNVLLTDVESGKVVYNNIVQGNSFTQRNDINLCTAYNISVEAVCGNSKSLATTYIITSPVETNINILGYNLTSCTPGNPGSYDLQLIIQHNGGNANGLELDIDGIKRQFVFENSSNKIQTLSIPDLPNIGNKDISIDAYAIVNSDEPCNSSLQFNIPSPDCTIINVEKFDFCSLPLNWSKSSSNQAVFFDPYDWKFADRDRNILNYTLGPNAASALTLDATCMAYFDDDVSLDPSFTGEIVLTSPSFSLQNASLVDVEFSYNFHKFEEGKGNTNNSVFSFEVFDGTFWNSIYEDRTDQCEWYDVWSNNCIETKNFDLSQYANDNLQVRFKYSDGNDGKWTGMVAIDNFQISSTSAVVLPLDFVSLDGRQNIKVIDLEWITNNEINVDSYLVERSQDGINFELIGKVSAKNNKENIYFFTDPKPLKGNNLYKITALDFQNKKDYVQYTNVNFFHQSDTKLHVFPNPNTGDDIQLYIEEIDQIQAIEIIDITGQIVLNYDRSNWQNRINSGVITLNINDLISGNYVIYVELKNQILKEKIIVL